MMKAAVVNAYGSPPTYGEFRTPVAGPGETVINVRAAPLSPIVRALAAGRHYTSTAHAGFVPGVDGVGIDAAGRRVYFLFPAAPFGSLGELALVQDAMCVPVPDDLSDVDAAAIVSGGLAAWIALTRRAAISPGSSVLINGATGASGGMAVQIARHFGAKRVIATGRNHARLQALQVEQRIALDDADADTALRSAFDQGVDVVLDFVWGEPAARVLAAATRNRASRHGEPRVRHVQIGTAAGDEISLRGDALRSSGLELLGSGIGSVSLAEMITAASELLQATANTRFNAPFAALPLSALAQAWSAPGDVRYILVPDAHFA